MLAGGRLSFDRAMADQSHKDVAAGRYVLHRFSTLSQAVVSRLTKLPSHVSCLCDWSVLAVASEHRSK